MKKAISMVSTLINMMTRPAAEKKSAKKLFASQLPMSVKKFAQNHFPGNSIAFAEKKSTSDGMRFSVTFNDGIQVVFNENGNWEMVDCSMGMVPATLVPSNITVFTDAFYPTTPIVKIQKVSNGFEVTLSNYITLNISYLEFTA